MIETKINGQKNPEGKTPQRRKNSIIYILKGIRDGIA